jgi:antitoxin CptB
VGSSGPAMQDQARLGRLQWHCRRGMKELDVLLERFLCTHRQALAAGRWPELETLLESEDDLLWDWLQNPAAERAAPWRPLLERIRHG